MTEPEGAPRPTDFAAIDDAPAPMQAMLLGALARMAESPQIQAVRAVARDALEPRPGNRLLDAGCGLGEAARDLAAGVAPGGEVVAVDASGVTVAAAAQRHDRGSVRYQVADVVALPFGDGEFDGVRCERVLQHLAEPDAAIRELARVTRPGGRVVLVDTDWESLAVDGLPEDLVTAVRGKLASRDLRHHQSMGRTLRRRALRAGLTDVTATPVPLVFTGDAPRSYVLPMFNREIPPEADIVPLELRDRWFDAVDDAAARGELLVVLTMWAVAGSPAA